MRLVHLAVPIIVALMGIPLCLLLVCFLLYCCHRPSHEELIRKYSRPESVPAGYTCEFVYSDYDFLIPPIDRRHVFRVSGMSDLAWSNLIISISNMFHGLTLDGGGRNVDVLCSHMTSVGIATSQSNVIDVCHLPVDISRGFYYIRHTDGNVYMLVFD